MPYCPMRTGATVPQPPGRGLHTGQRCGPRADRASACYESSAVRINPFWVAAAIQVLIANRPKLRRQGKRGTPVETPAWAGTCLQLFQDLNALDGIDRTNWPRNATHLAKQIKRIAPGLRRQGIRIERIGHTRQGTVVEIHREYGDS